MVGNKYDGLLGSGSFILLEKGCCNGGSMHPLFQLGKASFAGDTKWNFADKYIFDKEGACTARTSVCTLVGGRFRDYY